MSGATPACLVMGLWMGATLAMCCLSGDGCIPCWRICPKIMTRVLRGYLIRWSSWGSVMSPACNHIISKNKTLSLLTASIVTVRVSLKVWGGITRGDNPIMSKASLMGRWSQFALCRIWEGSACLVGLSESEPGERQEDEEGGLVNSQAAQRGVEWLKEGRRESNSGRESCEVATEIPEGGLCTTRFAAFSMLPWGLSYSVLE